jgi:hypothetical protein
MKYELQRLDGRFSYRNLFQYCIKFGGRMSLSRGPLHFTQVQKWFMETYGWSAEIRQYAEIQAWITTNNRVLKGTAADVPPECNPYWSWTNGYDDLRIYVKSDKELNFFQLRWPNEP